MNSVRSNSKFQVCGKDVIPLMSKFPNCLDLKCLYKYFIKVENINLHG